jgi:hypothetical protein
VFDEQLDPWFNELPLLRQLPVARSFLSSTHRLGGSAWNMSMVRLKFKFGELLIVSAASGLDKSSFSTRLKVTLKEATRFGDSLNVESTEFR